MMSRGAKFVLYPLAAALVLSLIALITGVLVVRSGWFHEKVRERIISEVERASGGRVEIGSFQFDWPKLEATVQSLVLHGKERSGEPALLRAASVRVGIKIVSALKKDVDLASAIIEKPEFHLIVYPDGTTNLPSPKVHGTGNFVENILKLKVRHYELHNGIVEFKEERLPLDIRGDNLNAALDYYAAGKFYRGRLSSRELHIETKVILPLVGDLDTDFTLEKDQMRFSSLRMSWPHSWVALSGAIRDWSAAHGDFDVRSNISLAELGGILRLPLERRGGGEFAGRIAVVFAPKFHYVLRGRLLARDLAYRSPTVAVSGVDLNADGEVTPAGVRIPRFTATGLGGTFAGHAAIPEFKRFEIDGAAAGLALAQLDRFGAHKPLPWSGLASGPVALSATFAQGGIRDLEVRANLGIEPASGGISIAGSVDIRYNQRSGLIQLGNSHLATAATKLDVSGTLGQHLQVSARSTNLKDVLPAMELFSDAAPKDLAVTLDNGTAAVDAAVDGPLDNPHLTGTVAATSFSFDGRHFDRLNSAFDISAAQLSARNLVLQQGAMSLTGGGQLALSNWRAAENSAVSASLNLRGADVKQLLKEAGTDQDVAGIATAAINLQGTYGSPRAAIQLTVAKPYAFGEQFDTLRADLRYTGGSVEVISGDVRLGTARMDLTGAYTHPGTDWTNGQLRFNVATSGLRLERIQHVRTYQKGIAGDVSLKASGNAVIRKGTFDLSSLDSEAVLRNIALDGSPLGSITATARTRGSVLDARVDGMLRDSKVSGSGEWRLEGNYPGKGEIQLSPITFATLQSIAAAAGEKHELPFQGKLEGRAVITGPLKKPDELVAEITLPHIEFTPNPGLRPRAGAQNQDLVLRNTAPVLLTASLKSVNIRSAGFTARDTQLDASGRVTFDAASPWNLRVNGSLNLAVLQLFNADLLARGNATLNAGISGPLRDPQVTGRLELRGASLYLSDIPVGVDSATGVIAFDRNRANIEKLTAEIGGGKVAFAGFIGFNSGLLVYRVQASADQVRIRYPEGVSITINSALDLTGTSQNSLVSGTLTVIRAGFTPKADLGSLLARTAKPISAPTAPNEYLRNVQLDVRIESGPSLQFQTSLTRDLQSEIDLHLRGNVAQPALVGDVSVNEGEISVFGSKYTINRGEIRFLNPTRIEPVFDLDLETKARGITVNLSFSGNLSHMNLTYRSDPPLQTSEIIALLAVGRDPGASAGLANGQLTQSSFLQSGSGLIGQALSAPVTSRLQRFFGVSRLKIDPQLTGVENIPQARLTLEQQVSRDITLTYITNLTRTNEQIVRVQWDINKEWSAIAVREENGVFGIDFQYRKRFK